MRARVPAVSRSGPAGPSPTTTTRGRLTASELDERTVRRGAGRALGRRRTAPVAVSQVP